MKNTASQRFRIFAAAFLLWFPITFSFAQTDSTATLLARNPSAFWSRVQIGGGVAAGFGGGYTNVTLAPSAIYSFNRYVALGVGLTGSYVRQRDWSYEVDEYRSWVYGGSIIGLVSPIEFIQLSLELEQLRVNSRLEYADNTKANDDFWNTGLFVGAGYRAQNVTVGLRYNILQRSDDRVYADALMPFVRVYF